MNGRLRLAFNTPMGLKMVKTMSLITMCSVLVLLSTHHQIKACCMPYPEMVFDTLSRNPDLVVERQTMLFEQTTVDTVYRSVMFRKLIEQYVADITVEVYTLSGAMVLKRVISVYGTTAVVSFFDISTGIYTVVVSGRDSTGKIFSTSVQHLTRGK